MTNHRRPSTIKSLHLCAKESAFGQRVQYARLYDDGDRWTHGRRWDLPIGAVARASKERHRVNKRNIRRLNTLLLYDVGGTTIVLIDSDLMDRLKG